MFTKRRGLARFLLIVLLAIAIASPAGEGYAVLLVPVDPLFGVVTVQQVEDAASPALPASPESPALPSRAPPTA